MQKKAKATVLHLSTAISSLRESPLLHLQLLVFTPDLHIAASYLLPAFFAPQPEPVALSPIIILEILCLLQCLLLFIFYALRPKANL